MFMKIANARKNNNKGFSLVELIIVIAIMVALVAVMAPQFTKYVKKSRDAALQTAAEDLTSALKTYIGDPDVESTKQITLASGKTEGKIVVSVDSSTSKLKVEATDVTVPADAYNAAGIKVDGTSKLVDKKMGSSGDVFTITLTGEAGKVVTGITLAQTTDA